MDAKEIREAAERVAAFDGKGGWYAIDADADAIARYILATVPADDPAASDKFALNNAVASIFK